MPPIFHADGWQRLTRFWCWRLTINPPQAVDLGKRSSEPSYQLTNYLFIHDKITRVLRSGSRWWSQRYFVAVRSHWSLLAAWSMTLWFMPDAQTQIGSDRYEWAEQSYNPLASTLFGSYCHYHCRLSDFRLKVRIILAWLIELVQRTPAGAT